MRADIPSSESSPSRTSRRSASRCQGGRPYLYKNFREVIEAEREVSRTGADTVEGVTVPNRTADESKHVEALLRNKVSKLKKELGDVRRGNARLKIALERERGLSEHYRENWINAESD